MFYRSPLTLQSITVHLASELEKLKEYYERQPDHTASGRSLPLSSKYVRSEFLLDDGKAKKVGITCAVTIGGWHPPGFKNHLIVGLLLIVEQVLLKGAVAMRGQLGIAQYRYMNFEAKLDVLPMSGKGKSDVLGAGGT